MGVCSYNGVSRLQPVHNAGQTTRISSLTRSPHPSLLCQGKGTISALFYTLISSHVIKSENECLNNMLHPLHLFLFPPSPASSPPLPFFCWMHECEWSLWAAFSSSSLMFPPPTPDTRGGSGGSSIKILSRTVPHGLPSLEDGLEMAPRLVSHGNTVQDTAGINTWVTNKCVVKRALIASFVRRLSLWQKRETFVSLFHRWPHRALDESPPPCFNWPQRQRHHSRSICSCLAPNLRLG